MSHFPHRVYTYIDTKSHTPFGSYSSLAGIDIVINPCIHIAIIIQVKSLALYKYM